MFVLIPLGGVGRRFSSAGYSEPKPLVRVRGVPIIHWVLRHLNPPSDSELLIAYNSALKSFSLEESIEEEFPDLPIRFGCLDHETRGAAETVKLAIEQLLSRDEQREPLLSVDGDTFYDVDVVASYLRSGAGNRVFCFEDRGAAPIYSYVEIQGGDEIVRIAEKQKISNWACSGAYGFESACQFVEHCAHVINSGLMQHGEFYISGVIDSMLNEGNQVIRMIPLELDTVTVLGTPDQVKVFAEADC